MEKWLVDAGTEVVREYIRNGKTRSGGLKLRFLFSDIFFQTN